MALFRKKIPIESAMRTFIGTALERDHSKSLSQVAHDGQLPAGDIEAMREFMTGFDLALWHYTFFEYAQSTLGAEEVSRRFIIALGFALRDRVDSPEEGQTQLERMFVAVMDYTLALESVSENELREKGTHFFCCQHFADLVLQGADLTTEDGRDRRFAVFHIAVQNYEAIRQTFEGFTSSYRITMS